MCYFQVCTKDNTCFCDEGWSGLDCSVKVKIIMTTGFLATTMPPVTTSTWIEEIQIFPIEIMDFTTKGPESSVSALIPGKVKFSYFSSITGVSGRQKRFELSCIAYVVNGHNLS